MDVSQAIRETTSQDLSFALVTQRLSKQITSTHNLFYFTMIYSYVFFSVLAQDSD